jgi:hypothetical protein
MYIKRQDMNSDMGVHMDEPLLLLRTGVGGTEEMAGGLMKIR